MQKGHQHIHDRARPSPKTSSKKRVRVKLKGPEFSVQEIGAMNRIALTALWRQVFATDAPTNMSQPILRRFLAFELQARIEGGYSVGFLTKLKRAAKVTDQPSALKLAPGARLLREWNGVTHIVDVTEGGYSWNGTTHRSLSAIAREITGARWSGPRFFGVTDASRTQSQ